MIKGDKMSGDHESYCCGEKPPVEGMTTDEWQAKLLEQLDEILRQVKDINDMLKSEAK